jgi:hypothetical protein
MGSTRFRSSRYSPARRALRAVITLLFVVLALAGTVSLVSASGSLTLSSLDSGWVLLWVLGILAAGLWLQSMRQRRW